MAREKRTASPVHNEPPPKRQKSKTQPTRQSTRIAEQSIRSASSVPATTASTRPRSSSRRRPATTIPDEPRRPVRLSSRLTAVLPASSSTTASKSQRRTTSGTMSASGSRATKCQTGSADTQPTRRRYAAVTSRRDSDGAKTRSSRSNGLSPASKSDVPTAPKSILRGTSDKTIPIHAGKPAVHFALPEETVSAVQSEFPEETESSPVTYERSSMDPTSWLENAMRRVTDDWPRSRQFPLPDGQRVKITVELISTVKREMEEREFSEETDRDGMADMESDASVSPSPVELRVQRVHRTQFEELVDISADFQSTSTAPLERRYLFPRSLVRPAAMGVGCRHLPDPDGDN